MREATAAARKLSSLALLFFFFVFFLGGFSVSLGQVHAIAGVDQELESSVFVPAPREIFRPISKAAKAIDKKEYANAVSLLGELLDNDQNEDYLVVLPGSGGVAKSLRSTAVELLGSVPEKERERYELRYGIPAQQMLDTAIEKSDYQSVSQVARKYFYTKAGFLATMLMGYQHLEEGHPVAAAFAFQRVVDCEEARRQYDPEVSVMLATCWSLAESESKAIDALRQLRTRFRSVDIQVMNQTVRLPNEDAQLGDWLTQLIGSSPLRKNALVNQWVVYRGNPQRNAYSGTGFPLLSPRWVVPVHNDPEMEAAVERQHQDYIYSGDATVPAVQPIAVGSTIVMRSFNKLIGIDFKTGKRLWVFPSFDASILDTGDVVANEELNARSMEGPLKERMWWDTVFGQVSSDGERIFVIPHPGFAETENSEKIIANRLRISDPLGQRQVNELKAVDVSRQGAFLWEVGGESGLDEPKLSGAYFLGPPLPLKGILYAVCQQKGEIRLVAMDPLDGHLIWSQQLAGAGDLQPTQEVRHRLAGASPSYSDGILVCPTNVGAVVAIELSTRSLLWGYQQSKPSAGSAARIAPLQKSNENKIGGFWRDSTVTIAEGKVVYTPVDRQELICLDLFTGEPAWTNEEGRPKATWPRNDSVYVGCVDSGRIVLVGVTSTRAVDIRTGEEVWNIDTLGYGRPSGRGYANRGAYFYPTTDRRLIKIDVQEGVVADEVRSRNVLGNLICYQGEVISHGVAKVETFPQQIPSRQLVDQARNAGRMTPELYLLDAQLLLHEGKLTQAATSAATSYDEAPTLSTQQILVFLITELVKSDFELGVELASRYEDLFDGESRMYFLAEKIEGMIARGSYEKAIENLLEMATPPAVFLEKASNEFVKSRDRRLSIRLDRWMQIKLAETFRRLNPAQADLIKTELMKLLDLNSDQPAKNQYEFAVMVGIDQIPCDAVLELASQLTMEGDSLRSHHLLQTLAQSSNKADAIRGEWELARLHLQYNDTEFVERSARNLRAKFTDAKLPDGRSGLNLAEQLQVDMQRSLQADLSTDSHWTSWKRGRALVTKGRYYAKPDAREKIQLQRNILQMIDRDNLVNGKYQLGVYGTKAEVELLDSLGNVVRRWSCKGDELNSQVGTTVNSGVVEIKNGMASIRVGNDVYLCNWLNLLGGKDPRLWNLSQTSTPVAYVQPARVKNLWGINLEINYQYGVPVEIGTAGFQGVCYLKDSSLICANALTGEELWRREEIPSGAKLYGDEDKIVVYFAAQRRAEVYDLLTGEHDSESILSQSLGSIWLNDGRNFLMSAVRDENPTMIYYDVVAGKTVWERSFDFNTRAQFLDRELIAVYTPSGTVQLIEMGSGKVKLETQVDVGRVSALDIKRLKDDYLLIFHVGQFNLNTRHLNDLQMNLHKVESTRPLYNGYMIPIDGKTGEQLWKLPARVEDFQICTSHPRDACVLSLFRRVTDYDYDQEYMQYAFIDLRNGRLLGDLRLRNHYFTDPRIQVDLEGERLVLISSDQKMVVQFTDEEQPPRGIAQLTNVTLIQSQMDVKGVGTTEDADLEGERAELLKRLKKLAGEQKRRAEEMKKRFEEQKKLPKRVPEKP